MKSLRIQFVFAALVLNYFTGFSQTEGQMRDHHVTTGVVIRDGREIPGYIKIQGTAFLGDSLRAAPWEFQKSIRFMQKDIFERSEKIRNRDFVKYGPDDIDGYRYHGDSLVFESVKYADMSAVGTGMIPKRIFMRKVSSGRISIFHHFHSPPPVGEVSELRRSYLESTVPEYVYRIGEDGKLKLISGLNVRKELADCPLVVEKFEKGEYGLAGDQHASVLLRLADKTDLREETRRLAIVEYNKLCR